MDHELTPEEESKFVEDTRRGDHARNFLNNPIYPEIMGMLHSKICDQIVNANTKEIRYDASLLLTQHYVFKQELENAVQDADYAQAELSNWERVKRTLKRVVRR